MAASGGYRHARPVRRKRPRHAPQRQRDDRHGYDLQSVQPARIGLVPKRLHTIGEQDECSGGRQREAEPRCEAAQQPSTPDADGYPQLAARRAGQELAERDEPGERILVQPLPPNDVRLAEVADVRDGAAERGEAEPPGGEQHLPDAPHPRSYIVSGALMPISASVRASATRAASVSLRRAFISGASAGSDESTRQWS